MLNIFFHSRFKVSRKFVAAAAGEYLNLRDIDMSKYDLNIIFVGIRQMETIAASYKQEDVALPVLSFSYLQDPKALQKTYTKKDLMMTAPSESHQGDAQHLLIGEIFICYPQAVLLAAERNKRVNETLTTLLTHGIAQVLK